MLKNTDIMAKYFIIIFYINVELKKERRIKMRLGKVGKFAFDELAGTKKIDTNKLVKMAEKSFSEGGKSSAKAAKLIGSLDGLAAQGKSVINSIPTSDIAVRIQKLVK